MAQPIYRVKGSSEVLDTLMFPRLRKRSLLILVSTSSLLLLALWGALHHVGLIIGSASVRIASSGSLQTTCDAFFSESQMSKTKFGWQKLEYIVEKVQEARLYGHCFLRHEINSKTDVADLESKLFPWLNFSPTKQLSVAKGRGIIMQLGLQGLDEIQRLIWVLDALENRLPLEVFYRDDVPKGFIESIDTGLQSIKFINVQHVVPLEYAPLFKRWANKWLAFMLTSFEEILYLDTDVVPFVNPEGFFQTNQYLESQSHFFRDRAIPEYVGMQPLVLYRSLLPSDDECRIFDMEKPKLEMLTGLKHRMESGVVVLNRKKYMAGLLMSVLLQFWEQTSSPFWGDKELFWLGQSVSAEESYRFGAYNAGSIGKLENVSLQANNPTLSYDESSGDPSPRPSMRLCSTKPAHFDDSLNLMWANGGLRNCKFNRSNIDWEVVPKLHKTYHSEKELDTAQKAPIYVDGAIIIPQVTPHSWLDWILKRHHGFEKDVDMGCAGYFWCAYDTPEHPGVTVRFDDMQMRIINKTMNAWFGSKIDAPAAVFHSH